MRHARTWALVMNGDHARILRGLEAGVDIVPEPIELASATGVTHRRDHLEDRTGRSFSSGASGRRSAIEPGSDPVLRDLEDFARATLDELETRLEAKEFDRIAIIAAPKMMGLLRDHYPPALRAAVIFEHSANLIPLPVEELRDTVLDLMHREAAES